MKSLSYSFRNFIVCVIYVHASSSTYYGAHMEVWESVLSSYVVIELLLYVSTGRSPG